LPILDTLLHNKIETQLQNKMLFNSGNLPSIGQISLLNTNRNVNCATISDSGAVMAIGLGDSSIKVFILSKK